MAAAAAADCCHMLPYCGEGGDGEGSLPRQLLCLIPPFLPSSVHIDDDFSGFTALRVVPRLVPVILGKMACS